MMSERTRRVLMTVLGVLGSGVGAGMLSFSNLGMDPFQVFAHGTWRLFPIAFGTYYMVLNAAMLVVLLFWNRRLIGLGTLINLFLLGYVVDGTDRLLALLFPVRTVAVQVGVLIAGIPVICFAAAVYFTADMGVSAYDAVALTLSERIQRIPFKYIRIITDLICVIIGWAMGVGPGVGIGTVITAFFMGPLISFFRQKVAEPMRYGRREESAA